MLRFVRVATAIGRTGAFIEGAREVVDLAIDTPGEHRREATAAMQDVWRNGALRKVDAVQRRSFVKDRKYHDQALWSIVDSERFQAKAVWGPKVH